jgi:hypothetical protein
VPQFQFPDGKTYEFPEGTTKSQAVKYYKKKIAPKLEKEPTTGDYARAAAQGLTFGFADEIEAAIRSAVGSKTYEEEVKGIRRDIERFREAAPVAAYGTEIGASALLPFGAARAGALGAKAATAAAARPVTTAIGTGALYGAGAAEEGERLKSAAIGGALGGTIGGAVSKALPKIAPEAKEMIRRGVPLTAGQAMGGAPRAFESTARALPFAGGVVEAAQQRATAQFSRTAVEDALKPLGLKLQKGVTGSDAVKQAFSKIDDSYDKLTPRLKIKNAQSMRDSVTQSIKEGVEQVGLISNKQQKNIQKYLKDIIDIFEGKEIAGKTFLSADKILGKKAYQLTKPAADDSDRVVGEVLRTVQRGIRDELKRQNPKARESLGRIHRAYERLMPVQSAAAKARAAREGGEFTPAELISSAVSQRRRAGAMGEAPMQAEGLIGQGILGQDRTGISRPILEARPILGLLGGGALGATGALAPAAAGLGLLAGAYSRAGVPVTRAALSGLGTGLRAPVPMTAGLLGAEFSQ